MNNPEVVLRFLNTEFHEVLFKLASEVFYDANSTITQRKNAIIALLATGSPMIPDYIHQVVK